MLPVGTPICVHIALDGGNDYLNTLAPVEDGWYRDANVGHGSLALTSANSLALTGTNYRLHKNLTWLADRWNTVGDVGFVLGVGNVGNPSFSHFDSMKCWETGQQSTLGKTGWLGRYADIKAPEQRAGQCQHRRLACRRDRHHRTDAGAARHVAVQLGSGVARPRPVPR